MANAAQINREVMNLADRQDIRALVYLHHTDDMTVKAWVLADKVRYYLTVADTGYTDADHLSSRESAAALQTLNPAEWIYDLLI